MGVWVYGWKDYIKILVFKQRYGLIDLIWFKSYEYFIVEKIRYPRNAQACSRSKTITNTLNIYLILTADRTLNTTILQFATWHLYNLWVRIIKALTKLNR